MEDMKGRKGTGREGHTAAVLSFTYLPEWNGVVKHIVKLKEALGRKGWTLRVYAPAEGADVPIKAVRVGFASALLFLPFPVGEKCILVEGYTNTMAFYAFLLSFFGKLPVWVWHGRPKGILTLPFRLLYALWRAKGLPIASVSPGKGEGGVVWIPNGVDVPAGVKPLPMEKRRGWAFIGRMDRNKNPLRAAELFHQMALAGEEGPFFFLGEDEGEMAKVVAFCREKGMDCRFGFLRGRAYWRLLSTLKGVLLPSSYEGQPLVMLEALAVGTPFYTARSGAEETLKVLGLPLELFLIEGKDGKRLLREWEEAFRAAQEVSLPSWEESAERWKALLSSLCGKGKGA